MCYICFAAWILFFLIEEGFALAQRTKGKLELKYSQTLKFCFVNVDSAVLKKSVVREKYLSLCHRTKGFFFKILSCLYSLPACQPSFHSPRLPIIPSLIL